MKQKNEISYSIKTKYGKFNIKFRISSEKNNIPLEFIVSVGSITKKCVQLIVPTKETEETNAKLLWVEAHEECSLERYIDKGLAQHMTLLGLTFIRKINPKIKTVTFEDMSSFKCDVPNEMNYLKTTAKIKEENKIQVPMKPFHIAFHEATWYEYYFDAKLEKDYDKYCELKKNMYKSEKKPKRFDFINDQLQEELEPLYNNTTTWFEFFQAIAKKYGKKKCAIVYPWISKAMYEIFNSNIYDDVHWYIDFEDNKKKDKTAMIDIDIKSNFTKIEGGKRITSKNRPARRFTYSRTHIFPHIREIQNWDFKTFLKKNNSVI